MPQDPKMIDSDGNDNVLVPPPSMESAKGKSVGASSDSHKNAMWRGQSNILVAVRVRPDPGKKVCTVMDGKLVVVKDPRATGPGTRNMLRANRSRERKFAFDYAFGPKSTQQQVYERTTKFLIDGILDGYNATVFAYGATGAGKTYTMLGSDTEPGIMVLTLRDMFAQVRRAEEDTKRGVKYKVSISYLEVYNELIRDLLTPSSDFLDLREDPIKGPTVAGISEVCTSSTDEVMRLLQKGNKRRTQEPTAANAESSRSHAVLQVCVEKRDSAPGVKDTKVKVGKLSMIDLAGSERASNTKNRGQRLIEGANINRSLLALGNCINALAQGSKSGKGKGKGKRGSQARGAYIPYRDSKLTRLLKDSLGGNCRTVMITNVSPAAKTFEESVNSLKYANRAKNIKTNVKRNVLNVKYHITEYVSLISGLKEEIAKLRGELDKKTKNEGSASENSGGGLGNSLSTVMEETGEESSDRSGGGESALGINRYDEVRQSKGSARFARIRNNIVANFQERMQLRRSLMELEATNVENHVEIERRRQKIAMLETDLGYGPECDFSDLDEFDGLDDRDLDGPAIGDLNLPEKDVSIGGSAPLLESKLTTGDEEEVIELEYEEDNTIGSTVHEREEDDIDGVDDSLRESDADADADEEEDDDEDVRLSEGKTGEDTASLLEDLEISEGKMNTESEGKEVDNIDTSSKIADEAALDPDDSVVVDVQSVGHPQPPVEAESRFGRRPTKSRRRRRKKVRTRRQELIHRLKSQIQELNDAIRANERLKKDINERLDKNRKQADALRQELSTRANSQERRNLMELEYRVLKVELEKLELERSTMLQEMVVRQRDELIHRARRQLRVRDLIIAAQQELLEANGLSVGPHIESLFARLEPTDEICDESRYSARNPMITGSEEQNGSEDASSAKSASTSSSSSSLATWAIKQAVYPVSKIDDIVTVDLAKSLQVARTEKVRKDTTNERNNNNDGIRQKHTQIESKVNESQKRRAHQHVVAPLPIEAPAPGRHRRRSGGGHRRRKRSRSRDRQKANRCRSQLAMHRESGRPAPGAPYRQAAPSARELERAKRRGDRNGPGKQRERMVVWEEGKSSSVNDRLEDVRSMISMKSRAVGISSSSSHLNDRENRDEWDDDLRRKRGVASDGRHKRRVSRAKRFDNRGNLDDSEVGLNTGWAERLKMYLKTPRSRFHRNKSGRSRSKSPPQRISGGDNEAGSKDAGNRGSASETKPRISKQNHIYNNSAPKDSFLAGGRSSNSGSNGHGPDTSQTPEGKYTEESENHIVEGKTFYVSSPPKHTGALDSTQSPSTTLETDSILATAKTTTSPLAVYVASHREENAIGVKCPVSPSPKGLRVDDICNRNDENAGNSLGRKMTPLPMIEKKDQRRFSSSPVPSNKAAGSGLFADSDAKKDARDAVEGRRALSMLNRKKKRRGGPVTSKPFWGKPRPSLSNF